MGEVVLWKCRGREVDLGVLEEVRVVGLSNRRVHERAQMRRRSSGRAVRVRVEEGASGGAAGGGAGGKCSLGSCTQ